MCGIVGAVNCKPEIVGALPVMLIANMDRGGKDGIGVWTPEHGLKKGLNVNPFAEIWDRRKDRHFLIHLRLATSGQIDAEHCHPFTEGDTVFCHNGHIFNYEQFGAKMDSLAGLAIVQRKGLQGIEDLLGSYVFTWFNLRERVFNVIVHRGELEIGWLGNTLFFASQRLTRIIPGSKPVAENVWLRFSLRHPRQYSMKKLDKLVQKTRLFWDDDYINWSERRKAYLVYGD